MDANATQLIAALDSLAAQITTLNASIPTLLETNGWNFPAVNASDIARRAQRLSGLLKEADIDKLDTKAATLFAEMAKKVLAIQNTQLQYFYNGHGHASIHQYFVAMQSIEDAIAPFVTWEKLSDKAIYPQNVLRRLRSIAARIDALGDESGNLDEKIGLINRAHEAAENLPIDVSELSKARETATNTLKLAAQTHQSIEDQKISGIQILATLNELKVEAEGIIKRCEDTYRITTSTGLAAAFDEKRRQLSNSLRLWTMGLVCALITGGILGHYKLLAISTSLEKGTNAGSFVFNVVVAVLSVGAPLWFAWLSTKQIGQRFRLIEDYSYKASISKAYEGYRQEAQRIDPEFEKQLFRSALQRLDEAPLRLMENNTHGSPFHEFIYSKMLGIKTQNQTAKSPEPPDPKEQDS